MFAVVDVVELLRHWQAGDSVSQMARALGLDRKTVRKYTARAQAAGVVRGGPALSAAEWAAKVAAWFPELADPRARSSVHGQIAPFHAYIAQQLATTAYSTPSRTLIPRQAEQAFHAKPNTDSTGRRTVIPCQGEQFLAPAVESPSHP